jgi:hypothetical protein
MGPVEHALPVPNYSSLEQSSERQNWHRQMPTVVSGPISAEGIEESPSLEATPLLRSSHRSRHRLGLAYPIISSASEAVRLGPLRVA